MGEVAHFTELTSTRHLVVPANSRLVLQVQILVCVAGLSVLHTILRTTFLFLLR
jgi:hypothetical protein